MLSNRANAGYQFLKNRWLTTWQRDDQRGAARVWSIALVAWLTFWIIVPCGLFLGYDQVNYQAAAERLNAGHLLYALSTGDRHVILNPPYWSSPLLYPPLIAVLWRPLAAVAPFGPLAWWLANSSALLGATAYVARRFPLLVVFVAPGVGLTIASGNVAGMLTAGTILVWRQRHDDRVGALIALMAAIKLTPATLIVWLLGTRRWRALAWAAVSASAALILTLSAGPESLTDYVRVVGHTGATPLSLSGLTGIPTNLAAAVGLVLVLLLPSRQSFRTAIVTSLVGSPMVGVASVVTLLAFGAPVAPKCPEKPPESPNQGGAADTSDRAATRFPRRQIIQARPGTHHVDVTVT